MCGIAGLLSLDPQRPPTEDELWAMAGTLRHRGPDEQNVVVRDGAGLGHTRLSIIDLAGGKQPMSTADGSLWLTFNGEIFNHVELRADLERRGAVFRTRSDTEVILQAYALDELRCVESFNGQFAFALWDRPRQRLVLARDRYGVRPLHITRAGGRFAFASEIKALFALPGVPRRLDPRGLGQTLSLWAPLAPQTAFEGITQLPPGHVMVVDGREGTETLQRFWDWPFRPAGELDQARSIDAWAEEVRERLIQAVRLRLMRSDVPVGAYLSGGLDSAIIATAVRRFSDAPLRTFSVTFEDAEFDESGYQDEVVAKLGTDHTAVRCTRAQIGAAFPRAIWHAETPLVRTAPTPMLVLAEAVRRAGYKVVLTGEGADEVFAGYDLFKEAAVRRFAARHAGSPRPSRLFERLYPYLPQAAALGSGLGQAFFQQGDLTPDHPFFAHSPRWSTTRRIWRFLTKELQEAAADDVLDQWAARLPADIARWEPLARDQYVEGHSLLSGYLLAAQGDRVAMASSVEGRFPFLDVDVGALAARIPAVWKRLGLREKHVLKKAFADLLPAPVLNRPKQPYRAPDSASFVADGELLPYVAGLLAPTHVKARGYFDPNAVARLADKAKAGKIVSFGDNMAFVGILSTMLLDWTHVLGHGPDVSALGSS